MRDWEAKLNTFLEFNEMGVCDQEKITGVAAKVFAESEYERFRAAQDEAYKSVFDKWLNEKPR